MTRKMLVVTFAKTKAVLAAASRRASGVPAAEELVGGGLVARTADEELSLLVPAAELEVKEVDYKDDVFRDPRQYQIDDAGEPTVPTFRIDTVSVAAGAVTVTVQADAVPTVPAGKAVVVVIDAGPNSPPLKFSGATTLNTKPTVVPVNGVPLGNRLVLATVDGYTSLLSVGTFV
jgi:hypothetical protein